MTLIIIAIVYGIIALGLYTAMIVESRRQEASMTFLNIVVAALWPFWLVWYSIVLIQEWWRDRGDRV